MTGAVYLCGGDMEPGPRSEACKGELHDWPLPSGYVDAAEMAGWRLRHGWSNVRCADCGLFGWRAGKLWPGETRSPAPIVPQRLSGATK